MGWTAMGSTATGGRPSELVHTGYTEHVPALFSFVRRQLDGDAYKAEDIVQETLLRCWRAYGSREAHVLRPWLFTVARNLVIDSRRRESARPREASGGTWPAQMASEPDSTESVLTSVVVFDALGALSPAHREIIRQTYFLGRTLAQTSQSLGIPVGTVKSRLHHACRFLRRALEERGVTPQV
ncbi:sigma-70 family RNA polymerase sigma factor [Streptomyces sp. NPDC002911]